MMKDKLKKYNLTASIHTFSVKGTEEPNIPFLADKEAIQASFIKKTRNWFTKINLNKLRGDIFTYSEFYARANELFYRMGIPNCTFWRTDIRLDSYKDTFKEYHKLNMLLLNLFSIAFSDKNAQAIGHMLTQSKEFSDISTANKYYEVKYYNKKFQTNDTDPAKARLEFRSLKSTNIGGHPPHEIKEIWFEKLDRLVALYEQLQDNCNIQLKKAYDEYCGYHCDSNSKRDMLTPFFSVYENGMTVFSRRQLLLFLKDCGVEERSAKDRADYICGKYKIEFFSNSDLCRYIEKIKQTMSEYFDC